MKNISEKQLEAIRAKREELKGLSAPLFVSLENGEIRTINDGLKKIYSSQGHTNLKSIWEWNSEGKQVIKGEHALLLWDKPKEREETKEQTEQTEQADPKRLFFPIRFVFSEKQVMEGWRA